MGLLYDLTVKVLWISTNQADFFPRRNSSLSQLATRGECASASTCSNCVQRKCAWCAESLTCIDANSRNSCADIENHSTGCSAVFLFPIPAKHRVIYVGKRSGGPEALVQLHLALLHWNFTSTLETRKRQVGKSLLPYFRDMYANDFNRFGVRMQKNLDYKEFISSGASSDVLILTETWPCRRGVRFDKGSGARQLQYHLTVQDRKYTYDVSHMYIPNAYPEECAVFTHTHYMTSVFMNQSSKATLLPYISPSILAAANNFKSTNENAMLARTIILYDGDALFDTSKVSPEFRPFLVKAASIKPQRLLKLFEKVLCVIDFGMPGAERLILEASLFGSIVIISDELNGVDRIDFPIPERFRLNGRDYSSLNTIIQDLVQARELGTLNRYVEEFNPFREFVRGQRTQFYRSVRRYFSDSAHFVLRYGVSTTILITAILVHIPLATITVVFDHDSARASFCTVKRSFLASVSRLYLESSISLVLQQELFVTPRQALLEFKWDRDQCFPMSYDFISIVATKIHHFQISIMSSRSISTQFHCFTVRLNTENSSLGNIDKFMPHTFNATIDAVAESVAQLHAAPHLCEDSMWNALKLHF
jgi:hypothetical protein